MGQMTFLSNAVVTGWIDYNLITKNVTIGNPNIYGYNGLVGYYISHGYLSFDTSTLPDNCTPVSASLELLYTLSSGGAGLPSTWIHKVYVGKDVIGAALDSGDWESASFKYDSQYNPVAGANNIVLAGVTNISTTGKTDFEFRDASAAMALGGWSAWFYGVSGGRSALLTVTYTQPTIRNAKLKNCKLYNA